MQLPQGIPGSFTLGGGMRVDQKDGQYYLVEYTDYVNPKFNTTKLIRELTQAEAEEMIPQLEAAKRWVWSSQECPPKYNGLIRPVTKARRGIASVGALRFRPAVPTVTRNHSSSGSQAVHHIRRHSFRARR